MIHLIINGANGQMGKVIGEMARKLGDQYTVVAGVDRFPPAPGVLPYPVYPSFDECKEACDVIVDFSLPDALSGVVSSAVSRKCALVVGTTGLQESHYQLLKQAGETIPVFTATNMSLGVNLQVDLIKRAAAILGESFDIEIIERHHNQKVDAPSGTAITLAKALRSQFPEGKEFVYDRHAVRQKRDKREIGISSVRGGTTVGEHEVLFFGEDEVLEITHKAQSKKIFAMGALRAAAFILGCTPRVYSMDEMIATGHSTINIGTEPEQSIISLYKVPYSPVEIADIFTAIADSRINIDMISQTAPVDAHVDLSFTLPTRDLQRALQALRTCSSVQIHTVSGMAKFSIEGAGMEHRPGIAAKMFRLLGEEGIRIKLVTTSETKISYCIEETNLKKAYDATLKAFEE